MVKKIVLCFILLLVISGGACASPQQDFIDELAPIAQEILPSYGLWPSDLLGQACQESGFGKSELAKKANNYFGRKCAQEPCIWILTPEYRNGKKVMELHQFQVYETVEEAVRDYAKKLLRKYSSGVPVYNIDASTPFTFIDSIAHTYATDPNYAIAVKRIIIEYELTKYDQ
jgi:flagellum-specific peptidoglycan hydrolase FlgJ